MTETTDNPLPKPDLEWIVIPKGFNGSTLKLTVMPVFDPHHFSGSGPFGGQGSQIRNWPQYLKESLTELAINIDDGSGLILPFKVDLGPCKAQLEEGLWKSIFPLSQPVAHQFIGYAAASAAQVYADLTSQFAKTSQQIINSLIGMHLSAQPLLDSLLNSGRLSALGVDHLFPELASQIADQNWTNEWKEVLVGFEGLSNIFLPVKPTLKEYKNARNGLTSEVVDDQAAGRDPNAFLHYLDQTYRGRRTDDKGVEAASDDPVFTAQAIDLFHKAISDLHIDPRAAESTTSATSDSWHQLAVKHLISMVAYKPEGEAAAAIQNIEQSDSNRLAAVLADPGLLAPLGLLFDTQITIHHALPARSYISVSVSWSDTVSTSGPRTAMTSGVPAIRSPDNFGFDSRGFLKLGADNGANFMLSDFRFDETFRKVQHYAHFARSLMPPLSPGSSAYRLPSIEFTDICSHDLSLHWNKRPAQSAEWKKPPVDADLYLQDLVTGIRPLLGRVVRVKDKELITWFDLTRKEVSYKWLKGRPRSPCDQDRDNGFVPLISYDKHAEQVAMVSELLSTWNGWTIGMALPDGLSTGLPLGKSERAQDGSLPPFRFGDRICMAAKLVLRDGSCLIGSEEAAACLGGEWDKREQDLIVGSREDNVIYPFRLLRWERLKAPVVLHDGKPESPKWWPAQTSSHMVVATSYRSGLPDLVKARRYIAVGREPDMFNTWKHGMFEKVEPTSSAYSNVQMGPDGNFATVATGVGKQEEAAYLARSSTSPHPYHPDPLVTALRIWATRRRYADSDELVPICEEGVPIQVSYELYSNSRWPQARALLLEVRAAERQQRGPLFELYAERGVLNVNLPAGEHLTLLIEPVGDSQVLSEKHAFGQQRLQQVLDKFSATKTRLQAMALASKLDEVHLPFLSSTTTLDIEHVLDRPAYRPQLKLTQGMRAPSDSSQPFSAMIGFDVGSTGSIEIHGSWVEPEGNLKRLSHSAGPNVFRRMVVKFDQESLKVELPDNQLCDTSIVRSPQYLMQHFEHEFHDCKHREVAYWTRGISAVASSVKPGGHNSEFDFAAPDLASGHDTAMREGNWMHIPASRKPKSPQLRYLLPAFAFCTEKSDGKITRTRTGVLALHLDGDWFDSGAGELLALVLVGKRAYSDDFKAVRQRYAATASFWGSDPLRQGQNALARLPDFLGMRHFPRNTLTGTYTLQDVQGELPVELVLFDPVPNFDTQSWRVEIPLVNPSAVSRPFVRLAFARFQSCALPGMHMSDIVMADYTQLSDDRQAVFLHDPADNKRLLVTVYGIGFEGADGAGKSRLMIWLERRYGQRSNGEAMWVAESEPIECEQSIREGRNCWQGELQAIESMRRQTYRVAVMEEEYYLRDGDCLGTGAIPVYFDLVPL